MSESLAVPSPPAGVPAARVTSGSWSRRAVLAMVAPEETDLPGRLTVAASVITNLPAVISAVLGQSVLSTFPQVFHLWNVFQWPLSATILAGGFMSRSRTARALAIITTAGLAGLFAVDRLGLSPAVVTVGFWAYNAAIASSLGLSAVRALRRRFTRDAE